MPRIFGIDIGTTSIGWAVIDLGPGDAVGRIEKLGVRIFPEARDPDGTPLNQLRRAKRMARRQLRRRRTRRRALNECLAEAGLLPPFGSDEWHKAMLTDPAALRTRGLTDPLPPHEFGRAIYHLAQHRHFKARELVEDGDTADAEAKEAEGQKTRADVTAEFDRLWASQQRFLPALHTTGLRERVADTIFSQRPVFWRLSTLGECRFMPGQELCPKGTWLSQQRRMLEKLNNLAVIGGNARGLEPDERAAILAQLQGQASMSWSSVRTALKPIFAARGEAGREKSLRFNLEEGGEKGLLGNVIEARLAKIVGPQWPGHPHRQQIRDAVPRDLWAADYGQIGTQRVVILAEPERAARRQAAAARFAAAFGLSDAQAEALSALKLPSGWEPYSVAALQRFLPELEAGARFGAVVNGPEWAAWRAATFPDRIQPTGEILVRLPSPAQKEEQERIGRLRNPTVARTQNELRKVVNNLLRVYGRPDLIRVEVARDVGLSKREREEKQDGIRKQERQRKIARIDLEKNDILEPSRADIEKWMLWKESAECCPYTGDKIGFDALFGRGDFEVEHIWPRSRSLDDSFGNKTLCRRDKNLAKGNRTPFEFLGGDANEWSAVQRRLDGLVAKKGGPGMSRGKVRRFLAQAMPDGFAARQLVDTGYAAREAIGVLKRLWPDLGPEAPVRVQAVTGKVTAQLRKLWGLNNILSDSGEKTREDHRHHAIDAFVVACTDPGITNKLSRYWQQRDQPTAVKPQLTPPWEEIRADATRATAEIVVSHRVRKKVSGSMHQEMPLGYTGDDVSKRGTNYGVFVKRMAVEKLPLATLAIGSVEETSRSATFVVRDRAVREILATHVNAAGGKPEKAYPPYPRVSPDGPEIRKVRVLTIQQKELMVPAQNGFVSPANNHHIAIYRGMRGKVEFSLVSLIDAAQRLSRREPVVRRKLDDGASFLMSLAAGEAVRFRQGEREGIWIVNGFWDSGVVVLKRANDADNKTTWLPRASVIVAMGGQKIAIDPIGRIRPASD